MRFPAEARTFGFGIPWNSTSSTNWQNSITICPSNAPIPSASWLVLWTKVSFLHLHSAKIERIDHIWDKNWGTLPSINFIQNFPAFCTDRSINCAKIQYLNVYTWAGVIDTACDEYVHRRTRNSFNGDAWLRVRICMLIRSSFGHTCSSYLTDVIATKQRRSCPGAKAHPYEETLARSWVYVAYSVWVVYKRNEMKINKAQPSKAVNTIKLLKA